MAEKFAASGTERAIVVRRTEPLAETGEIVAAGVHCRAYAGDVSDADELTGIFCGYNRLPGPRRYPPALPRNEEPSLAHHQCPEYWGESTRTRSCPDNSDEFGGDGADQDIWPTKAHPITTR